MLQDAYEERLCKAIFNLIPKAPALSYLHASWYNLDEGEDITLNMYMATNYSAKELVFCKVIKEALNRWDAVMAPVENDEPCHYFEVDYYFDNFPDLRDDVLSTVQSIQYKIDAMERLKNTEPIGKRKQKSSKQCFVIKSEGAKGLPGTINEENENEGKVDWIYDQYLQPDMVNQAEKAGEAQTNIVTVTTEEGEEESIADDDVNVEDLNEFEIVQENKHDEAEIVTADSDTHKEVNNSHQAGGVNMDELAWKLGILSKQEEEHQAFIRSHDNSQGRVIWVVKDGVMSVLNEDKEVQMAAGDFSFGNMN